MKKLLLGLIVIAASWWGCKKYDGDTLPVLPPAPTTQWKAHNHPLLGFGKVLLSATVAQNQYRAMSPDILIKLDGNSVSTDRTTTGWILSGIDAKYPPKFSNGSYMAHASLYYINIQDVVLLSFGTDLVITPATLNAYNANVDALKLAYETDFGDFVGDEHFITAINQTATPNNITLVVGHMVHPDNDNNGKIDAIERAVIRLDSNITLAQLPPEAQNTVTLIKGYLNHGFVSTHQNTYRVATNGTVTQIFPTQLKDIIAVGNTLYADVGSTLFSSADTGKTWQAVKNNLDNTQARKYFYVPPYWGYYHLDRIFVAQPDYSFTEVENNLVANNKISAINKFADSVFVATNNGLYVKSIKNFVQ